MADKTLFERGRKSKYDHNSRPIEERFWEKVKKSDYPDGCWNWTGARSGPGWYKGGGYGIIGSCGKNRRGIGAHRVSYMLNVGEIPEGMCVCHRCDNPRCVRPDHLFLGTQSDNMQDASRKGRTRGVLTSQRVSGEKNVKAKLNREQVELIRKMNSDTGEPYGSIARRFGVTSVLIGMIVRRQIWK